MGVVLHYNECLLSTAHNSVLVERPWFGSLDLVLTLSPPSLSFPTRSNEPGPFLASNIVECHRARNADPLHSDVGLDGLFSFVSNIYQRGQF